MNVVTGWILIDEHKRILLIKRKYDKVSYANYWSLPSWKLDEWEDPKAWAIREVKEEVWLDFEIDRLFFEETIRRNHYLRYIWTYSWNICTQEEECDGYGWFNFEEVNKLLISDQVKEIAKKLKEEGLM